MTISKYRWMTGNQVLKDASEEYLRAIELIEDNRLQGHNYKRVMNDLQHKYFICYSKAQRIMIMYNKAYAHVHGRHGLLSSHKNKIPDIADIALIRMALNAERHEFEKRHGLTSNKLI
jgi:hypothetical protein